MARSISCVRAALRHGGIDLRSADLQLLSEALRAKAVLTAEEAEAVAAKKQPEERWRLLESAVGSKPAAFDVVLRALRAQSRPDLAQRLTKLYEVSPRPFASALFRCISTSLPLKLDFVCFFLRRRSQPSQTWRQRPTGRASVLDVCRYFPCFSSRDRTKLERSETSYSLVSPEKFCSCMECPEPARRRC